MSISLHIAAVVIGAPPGLFPSAEKNAGRGESAVSLLPLSEETSLQINPYLTFDGTCEMAFRFYEQCLGATIIAMMPHAGTPMAAQTPPEWQDKILHATLRVGDTILMGSDAPPSHYRAPQGFSVSLLLADPVEAERIFHALAEGGTVRMPIQQTFWAARFGTLTDRFGIPWMINCEQAREGARPE